MEASAYIAQTGGSSSTSNSRFSGATLLVLCGVTVTRPGVIQLILVRDVTPPGVILRSLDSGVTCSGTTLCSLARDVTYVDAVLCALPFRDVTLAIAVATSTSICSSALGTTSPTSSS